MSCDVLTNNPPINYFKTEAFDDDASTVINVSLLKRDKKKDARKRKHESESDELFNSTINNKIPATEVGLDKELVDPAVNHVGKVVGWLESSLFESYEEEEGSSGEKCLTENFPDRNLSDLPLGSYVRRVSVFLMEIEPNPEYEPLEIVSGYCNDGCKKYFTYSTIAWSQEDNSDIPLCPGCSKPAGTPKELKLMFKFKLKVMDTHGLHVDFNVWRDAAEKFLGCSTENFIRSSSVREAAILPLTQSTVLKTMFSQYTPVFDLDVTYIKDSIFLAPSSRLRKVCGKSSDAANPLGCREMNKSVLTTLG